VTSAEEVRRRPSKWGRSEQRLDCDAVALSERGNGGRTGRTKINKGNRRYTLCTPQVWLCRDDWISIHRWDNGGT
jgi:hypothetical protein